MNKTTRFILLIIVLALCFYFGRSIDLDPTQLKEKLNQYPLVLSSIVFVVLYVFITFFVWFVAKDVFRIASALIYGPYISALLVYLGEMGNAFVLFHLSRKLGQEYVVQKLGVKEEKLKESNKHAGFLGNFTIRINLVPFRIQDLGAGLTTVSFKKYLSAIAIASAPRILLFQYAMFELINIIKDPEIFKQFYIDILKDPQIAQQFVMEHQKLIIFFLGYFLFVGVFTIFYIIQITLKKRKTQEL